MLVHVQSHLTDTVSPAAILNEFVEVVRVGCLILVTFKALTLNQVSCFFIYDFCTIS